MLSVAVLILFPSLMAYAASSDLLTMTIANWVSVALVVGFLAVSVLVGMSAEDMLVSHLACGAAVLALTFALFAFGWIGGGDAKLAAATAVWLGWDNLYAYGLTASVAGGALTLLILGLRRMELPTMLGGRRPDALPRHGDLVRGSRRLTAPAPSGRADLDAPWMRP